FAWQRLAEMTDTYGSRLSGSENLQRTIEWAMAAMKADGLENVRAEPVAVERWERGAESAELLGAAPQRLAVSALGNSVGTPPEGVEAEVVEVPSLDALDALGRGPVEGKIVFVNAPTARTRDGSGYGVTSGVRRQAAARAGALGAKAVVIRSVGTDQNRLPHTGSMRYAEGAARVPAAALAAPDADLLHRAVASGSPARLRLVLGCKALPDGASANVVGEVVGRDRPDEIVLIGAHLDSWDLGTGALDDGAGCAIVLDVARQLARPEVRPRRTLRVALFANEENGLSGAKAYAEAHRDELARHAAALEADSGAGRVYAARVRAGEGAEGLRAALGAALAPFGAVAAPEPANGGADLRPLRPAGVPLVDLAQDMHDYFDHHHSANDTFDKIDRDAIGQAAGAWAAAVRVLTDAPLSPGRAPEGGP
ncbi:MAG TPA: M20/M25/M40 family metallo-hydrolase, partial [Polyangiaceae bacterium]|nr:M20/M25/M40 family metallo-hydrolase [Polyangiaceae bacterium]